MAEGTHAFPSRTRPLSPPASMVLEPQGSGRVERCQASPRRTLSKSLLRKLVGGFLFWKATLAKQAILQIASNVSVAAFAQANALGPLAQLVRAHP
jgi:hypothetical protein